MPVFAQKGDKEREPKPTEPNQGYNAGEDGFCIYLYNIIVTKMPRSYTKKEKWWKDALHPTMKRGRFAYTSINVSEG